MESSTTQIEAYQEQITLAAKVKTIVNSEAWQNIIEPLFDKMITDILGGKENGRWINGSIDNASEVEEKLKYLQAQKSALVNLHQAIYGIIDDGDEAELVLREYNERLLNNQNYYGDVDGNIS